MKLFSAACGILLAAVLLGACAPPVTLTAPTPVAQVSPAPTSPAAPPQAVRPVATAPAPTATGAPQTAQPAAVPLLNPLTGLPPNAPANLERRPLLIKVENLPRNHRPQSGLNSADVVFEYYTEEGTTRFAALFYGQDAARVTPIRSARYFDMRLVRAYRANFIFGGAYERLWQKLLDSDFANRLIVEGAGSCPALCRTDPNGANLLAADTAKIADYLQRRGMDNTRPDLAGMVFQARPPAGGKPGRQVSLRFSAAIYNRWEYDPASGAYRRWVDAQDDLNGAGEKYIPLADALTGEQVDTANLVLILAPYFQADPEASSEVLDVRLESAGGPAYLWRDGQVYLARWQHDHPEDLITLTTPSGAPLLLKPGRTWFEIMGAASNVQEKEEMRVVNRFP